jgi:5-methylcytosine-specific restriction endonuclease McrA
MTPPRRRSPVRRQPSGGQLTSRKWRRIRDQVVQEEPVCRLQLSCCTMRSTTADHVIPVKFRPDLKYVRQNLRGSCGPCNRRRGARPLGEVRAEEARAGLNRQPARPAAALAFFDPKQRFAELDNTDTDTRE